MYAADLMMRWTMPIGYDVVESDLPANYKYTDGGDLLALPTHSQEE